MKIYKNCLLVFSEEDVFYLGHSAEDINIQHEYFCHCFDLGKIRVAAVLIWTLSTLLSGQYAHSTHHCAGQLNVIHHRKGPGVNVAS